MDSAFDKKDTWKNILESIKVSVSDATFRTWFSQTHLADLTKVDDRYVAQIGCNSSFVKATLESRYFGMLQDALSKELEGNCDLLFIVKSVNGQKTNNEPTPLFDTEPPSAESFENLIRNRGLRSSYNFESFAVSSSNQMAHAAAQAVSDDPGKAYNPLFIWGGVGVGKTHLMSAVGYRLLQKDESITVHLSTGEQFTNDIVEGIRNKTTPKVRAKYRKLKVLLIDDIQFIAGKDTVQEEFFHTFNALVGSGSQIILTSDRPPNEIPKLEERLRSRFEAGLIVDIAPLDFELRCAICQIKAKDRGIALDSELVSLIAGNITEARAIEGYLVKLIAKSKLNDVPINEDLIKSLLGKSEDTKIQVRATPDEVIKAACKHFSILKRDLIGPRRARPVALPRQIVMYFLRTELQLPLEEVGRIIGGRDHTTVMHAVDKITLLNSKNVQIREDLKGIKNAL